MLKKVPSPMENKIRVFSGNSNPVSGRENLRLSQCAAGQGKVKTFSDGEIMVEIGENVRGRDIYVVQSTCDPTNNNLMELLIMMDALKRASAATITAVMPYYGYARQDRKAAPQDADHLQAGGRPDHRRRRGPGGHRRPARRPDPGLLQHPGRQPLRRPGAAGAPEEPLRRPTWDLVMVSPDAGGTERARAFAKRLGCTLAVIDKRRTGPNVARSCT